MATVLLVDDDCDSLEWLAELARLDGCAVLRADSLRSARLQLGRERPDLILTDLLLPDGCGIALLQDADTREQPELVVITGHATLESAVAALRAGASDYLVKPIDVERLRTILARLPRPLDPRQEIAGPRAPLRRGGDFGQLIGRSAPMQRIYAQLGRVAPTAATVLLLGESGTGKELAAQTVHALSRRRRQPFLPINCGAVAPQLIESELFGHEKGSFTGADRQHKGFFERAHGGTILLDEITEMPLELQVKLLRVLETGSLLRVGGSQSIAIDVRLIAATNRNPEQAVVAGKLREDLYHRLNVFPVTLPPLRERGVDIELLAGHFIAEINALEGTSKGFSPAAVLAMRGNPWPGNVRELRNYVQRAHIMADEVLEADVPPAQLPSPDDEGATITFRIGSSLASMERRMTLATLMQCGNVKRQAAEVLGISLKTLYNRLEGYAGKSPLAFGEVEDLRA